MLRWLLLNCLLSWWLIDNWIGLYLHLNWIFKLCDSVFHDPVNEHLVVILRLG